MIFLQKKLVAPVKREEHNRDLTIWFNVNGNREAYVVENKFKSMPRQEQLKEYEKDLGGNFAGGLLVALQVPNDFQVDNWRTCTQKDILERIAGVLKDDVAITTTERELIREYVDMTQRLSEILTSCSAALGKRWPLLKTAMLLEEIKLGDIFQKIKAAEFVTFVESNQEISEWRQKIECRNSFNSESRRLRLEVTSDFSHKQALVDFRIVMYQAIDGKWKEKAGIGIQLQGDAYNRCVYTYDTDKGNCWLDREFSTNWLEEKHFLVPSLRLNKDICGYKTAAYVFRYIGTILRFFFGVFMCHSFHKQELWQICNLTGCRPLTSHFAPVP